MKWNCISLDGGGIRGVLTSVLIDRIQKKYPQLLVNTQLFAGTSIGGIQALAYAAGILPTKLIDLFSTYGHEIFPKSLKQDILGGNGFYGVKYSNKGLQENVKNLFEIIGPDSKLKDLPKKVLIPSFETDNNIGKDDTKYRNRTWKPVFFHNFKGNDSDEDELIVDVALATSAAPVYYSQYKHYIDGGVCCNNPSFAAVSQILDKRNIFKGKRPKLEDIRLLSIGTGQVNQYLKGQDHKWGALQWGKPLLNILFEANSDIAHYYCKQILRDNYERLQPIFSPNMNIPLDGADKVQELIDFAYTIDISETLEWLNKNKW